VLPQRADKLKLLIAQQLHNSVLKFSVIQLQNFQHLFGLLLRHKRILVELAQTALQPIGVNVARVQFAFPFIGGIVGKL